MTHLRLLLPFAALLLGGAFPPATIGCSGDASLGDNRNAPQGDASNVQPSADSAGSPPSTDGAGSPPSDATSDARAQPDGDSSADANSCGVCIRAVECVQSCGGPVLVSGCCPCQGGTIDRAISCGDAGDSGSEASPLDGGDSGDGASGEGGIDLGKWHAPCVNGTCPSGLTPTHYYGIGGPLGQQFCSCEIPCAFPDASACPPSTSCQYIADGPGPVCD